MLYRFPLGDCIWRNIWYNADYLEWLTWNPHWKPKYLQGLPFGKYLLSSKSGMKCHKFPQARLTHTIYKPTLYIYRALMLASYVLCVQTCCGLHHTDENQKLRDWEYNETVEAVWVVEVRSPGFPAKALPVHCTPSMLFPDRILWAHRKARGGLFANREFSQLWNSTVGEIPVLKILRPNTERHPRPFLYHYNPCGPGLFSWLVWRTWKWEEESDMERNRRLEVNHCIYQLLHVSKGNSHVWSRLHLLQTSGRASDKPRKELLFFFFMEIQSSLMPGNMDPSKMVSDRHSNVSDICSGKQRSCTPAHFHMCTWRSALLLSPWKQWEIIKAFRHFRVGAGK